ncbi:hypothetical protein BB561_005076 [Smittium simulii]|uniref:Uncharacterized protein n=1 Tax=Smittium simulii TaxID=133385 RepID=A0A2T9YCD9_9FUNG|nr:hypothetical protein BB561_005076 [Smittium simulii]
MIAFRESNETDLDCYSDSTNEIDIKLFAASDNKRIRVCGLVSNDYSQITRRVTLDQSSHKNKKSINKKPKKQQKNLAQTLIPRGILDVLAPISNAELFKLKPELTKNMQEEIRYLGLPSKKNYMLYNENPIDKEPKTYIVSTILKRKIPVFVDTAEESNWDSESEQEVKEEDNLALFTDTKNLLSKSNNFLDNTYTYKDI